MPMMTDEMMAAIPLLFFGLLLLSGVQASPVYNVRFDVDNLDGGASGEFVIEVHEDWCPLGAARFKEMVDSSFFRDIAFFRVIEGFMAQFGIAGEPGQAAMWRQKTIRDDPVTQSNKVGYVSFATAGPNTRTTQMVRETRRRQRWR